MSKNFLSNKLVFNLHVLETIWYFLPNDVSISQQQDILIGTILPFISLNQKDRTDQ